MASDIGVKMSVSGIAQFKSAMTQGKSAVKQLDAELKLNAAQYKASGDAEEYMAGRTRILSQQIKAQEGVVESCEKALETMATQGVDKTSASYTRMAAELAKAKTDLINMKQAAADTGDELKEMSGDADQATKSLQSIDKSTKLTVLTNALGKADQLLTNMLRSIVEIGKGLWDMGRGAAQWGDDLATDALKYGIDPETLQRWQAAENAVDTTVEDIIKATDKLTQATKNAEGDVALIMAGTGQIGVQIRDETGAMRSQMDIFWDYVEALGKVENETERNMLAQEVFGKSYRDVIPLIEAGRESWEAAAESAKVVSNEDVEKLQNLNDVFDQLEQNWQTTKMTLLAQLAPAFEKVAEALDYLVSRLKEWAESPEGQAAMQRMGDAVANLIETMADGDFFEKMFEDATKALETIASLLEKISGDDIKNGLIVIAGIIAGMKFANATVNTINALHSLGLGGSNGVKINPTQTTQTTQDNNSGTGFWGNLSRMAESVGTGLITKSLAKDVAGKTEEESNAWATAAAIGTWINPWLGSAIAAGSLIDMHAADDSVSQVNPLGIKYHGKDIGYGWWNSTLTSYEPVYEKNWRGKDTDKMKWYGVTDDIVLDEYQKDRLAKYINDPYYGFNSFSGTLDAAVNGIDISELLGLENGYVALLQSSADDADALLATITATGELYFNYIEDVNEYFAQLDAAMGEVEQPEQPEVKEAGSEMSASFAEGALDNIDAAFAAGEALGAAFTSGVGSGTGGSPTTTNYNSRYIGAVNINGIFTAAEMAAAVRQETERQQAGYGG